MRARFAVAVLAIGCGLAAPARGDEPKRKPKDIDLVLCLDVSNSMDGLIDSAKLKLWDVVNELAKVKPTPNLRVGLYSYGHAGYPLATGYVRKDLDLSTDLDTVYAKLNALRTNGGEEYVARVTTAALHDQKWSADPGALRIIFVCGNEPANQDPKVTMQSAAAAAKQAGVVVNSIYCGGADDADGGSWRTFAGLCGGKFANIDQGKARRQVAAATPFDKELADLSGKLNTTYLAYGADGKKGKDLQLEQDKLAENAAGGAAAARGASKASGLYKNDKWDILDKLQADPKFDVRTLKEEDLPEELKKLTPDERVKYVAKKAAERAEIQKNIAGVAAKRQKHLDELAKTQPKGEGEKALDEALKAAIREQAAAKGLEIPK